MRRFSKFFITVGMCMALASIGSATFAYEHNITSNYASYGPAVVRTPINVPMPIAFNYTNTGDSNEINVKLYVIITNTTGVIYYRDSAIVSSWASGINMDVSFKDFTPWFVSNWKITGIAALDSDQYRSDDTAFSLFRVGYEADIKACGVISPDFGAVEEENTSFKLIGSFQSVGISDEYEFKVRVKIVTCFDNITIFQADTIMPELYVDSPCMTISFPIQQGIYDIRKLPAGCYNIFMIVSLPNDGDRSDDTTSSNFTIVKHYLDHDISGNKILSPPTATRQPADRTIPISAEFRNIGLNTESNFNLVCTITTDKGAEVYRDTALAGNWSSLSAVDESFRDFNPPANGNYKITFFSDLLNDSNNENDTLKGTFIIGSPCDVGAIRVLYPGPGQTIAPGIGFAPGALFRWEGLPQNKTDIPVSLRITRCTDGALIYEADSTIPESYFENGDAEFYFAPSIRNITTSSLPEGCYNLSIISQLQCDSDYTNNAANSYFSIGTVLNNINVSEYLWPPAASRVLLDTSVVIRYRLINEGTRDQPYTPIYVFIVDPNGRTAYSGTIGIYNWKGGQKVDTSFMPFIPTIPGEYKCCVISQLYFDEYRNDDTLWSTFRAVQKSDVSALSVYYPEPNAIIPLGREFQPVGIFQSFFGVQDINNIPVSCRIMRCGDNQLLFQSDTVIPALQLDSAAIRFPFPTQQGAYNIRTLQAGCYNLQIIAAYPPDTYHNNDTAFVPFSVFAQSAVEENLLPNSVTLEQNFPNPFAATTTVSYSLPEEGRVSFRIYDITGRVIQSELTGAEQEAGAHSINFSLSGLPSGVYIYELAFTNKNGETIRRSQRMTVMK